ncbi:MAG TPA: TMEM175 family protein [Thermoanaerobaculia bacterium]
MQKQPFRMRGQEVTRVEAFSDVVFGFALTLIVVSLEVPQSFDELMKAMRGFPAFAICFATLTWVWHCHHTFFRRYALTDEITIALNTLLLFVVLFYTYPMKYMFSMITQGTRDGGDASTLFLIYGLGFAGIFGVFVAMYVRAWNKRDELELNELERHDTITNMTMYIAYVVIGLLSVTIGLTASRRTIGWAGLTYFLIGPVSAFIGYKRGSARHNLQVAMAQRAPNTMQTDAVPSVAAVGPH